MKKQIAVVGGGYWGEKLIRNFHALDTLYAICDSDKSRLDSFKTTYPQVNLYEDFNQVLNDSNVSAVVIATSSSTHYDLTKRALEAGKDVLVEKPLALYLDQGEELVVLAESEKRILMVGHILIYHPVVFKLKTMVRQGDLGKIQYIYSNRLNLGKFRTEENILWSFAPHDISLILHLLDEMPESVFATGGNYLNKNIADVTVTTLNFPGGVRSHIFVSWLHPYKEQKMVIIGDKKMAVFNDVDPANKLTVYDHKIDWINRIPVPLPEIAKTVQIDSGEPLRIECEHFLDCLNSRNNPITNGKEGLRILKVLSACQDSLERGGEVISLNPEKKRKYFVHASAFIDEPCEIGEGTKIWHFSHILKNSKIGKNCTIGQNASIGPNVTIGNNVKIQNNVSVYEGVILEDDAFCGPSVVFTNVTNPRSHVPQKSEFKPTLIQKGASLGANATILCGVTIGKYAFIGAGAFVNKNIPDFALVYGSPARLQGWVCYCGMKLDFTASRDSMESVACQHCERKYKKEGHKVELYG